MAGRLAFATPFVGRVTTAPNRSCVLLLLAITSLGAGCQDNESAALHAGRTTATLSQRTMPRDSLSSVLARRTPDWMAIPGVVGTAEGVEAGQRVIMILVVRKTPQLEARLPRSAEGWPVILRESGKITAPPP